VPSFLILCAAGAAGAVHVPLAQEIVAPRDYPGPPPSPFFRLTSGPRRVRSCGQPRGGACPARAPGWRGASPSAPGVGQGLTDRVPSLTSDFRHDGKGMRSRRRLCGFTPPARAALLPADATGRGKGPRAVGSAGWVARPPSRGSSACALPAASCSRPSCGRSGTPGATARGVAAPAGGCPLLRWRETGHSRGIAR
jgi:hypothetical protein